MRIELLLCVSSTILNFISASGVLILPNTNGSQILKNSSDNKMLHFAKNAGEKHVKPTWKTNKKTAGGEFGSLSPATSHDVGFSSNHEESSRFHIFKIKPKYSKKRYVNQWNEKSNLLDVLPFHQNFQFPNYYLRRGFDSYKSPFNHRNRFNGYRSEAYPQYFHPIYGNRNFAKRFMNRRENMDEFLLGSYARYPEKAFEPDFAEENIDVRPTSFLPTNLRILHKTFSAAASDSENTPIKIPNDQNPPGSYSETVEDILNKTSINTAVSPGSLDNVPNGNKIYDNNHREFSTSGDTLHSVQNRMFSFEQENSAPFDSYENEIMDEMPSSDQLERSERENTEDNLKVEDLDLLANNRVFYDKVPQNLNDSWFVYVNCSRENCQFTNSTSETELIKEGWVLHNCTKNGCREIYPKTEAIRKFIGLMLLVFSLCIMKILAFVLLFYYCRNIKLSKQGSEEQNSISSDEEKKSPRKKQGKYVDKEATSEKQVEDSELTFLKQIEDGNIPQPDNKPLSSLLRGVGSNDSKAWTPSIEKVSSCFITPDRDILTPTQGSEKIVLNFKNSDKLLKNKRTNRSSIPRLEKFIKCGARKDVQIEDKQMKSKDHLKESNGPRSNVKQNGELLLMNLDDDTDSSSSCFPGKKVKSPKWEEMLKNECKSFISVDLRAEDFHRNNKNLVFEEK